MGGDSACLGGSYSLASLEKITIAALHNIPVLRLEAESLPNGSMATDTAIAWAADWLKAGPVLIATRGAGGNGRNAGASRRQGKGRFVEQGVAGITAGLV